LSSSAWSFGDSMVVSVGQKMRRIFWLSCLLQHVTAFG